MEEVKEELNKEEKVKEQLMKMESRMELVEQQAAVCQRRSGCNSQILGELLHILPPLLPVSSFEQFLHLSLNMSSEAPKYNYQLQPPVSAPVPVNNQTFEAHLPPLTVGKQDNSTPRHLKYFSMTGKILEIDSIQQQTELSKPIELTNSMNNSQKRDAVDPKTKVSTFPVSEETSKLLPFPHSSVKSQSRSNSGGIINGIENANKKPDLEMENPDEGFPSISGKCRSSNLSEIGKQKIDEPETSWGIRSNKVFDRNTLKEKMIANPSKVHKERRAQRVAKKVEEAVTLGDCVKIAQQRPGVGDGGEGFDQIRLLGGDLTEAEAREWRTRWREVAAMVKRHP